MWSRLTSFGIHHALDAQLFPFSDPQNPADFREGVVNPTLHPHGLQSRVSCTWQGIEPRCDSSTCTLACPRIELLTASDQLRPPLCSSSTHSSPLLAILHHLHHPRARRLSLLVLTGSLTTPPLHLFSDNTSHHGICLLFLSPFPSSRPFSRARAKKRKTPAYSTQRSVH